MRVAIYGVGGKLVGGIETFVLNMNEHMSDACIFDYIIDGATCIHQDRIAQKGGNIFYITPIRENPFAYVRDMWRALSKQKKDGTRLLYIQLFSMANVLPMLIGKLQGYTVVLHAHNNGLQSKSPAYGVLHGLGKLLTSAGNYIRLTNSRQSAQFMFGKHKKAELVYNAIDVQKFAFHKKVRDQVRLEHHVAEKVIIGFVGRLASEKNPLSALRVFAEFRKAEPKAMLWIVGEGGLQATMEQEIQRLGIEDSVHWFGRRDDVELLMQGMDLLLLPSLFEGLGIVLIEAQAAGLPCITSKDVVPQEAGVTDLVQYISLQSGPVEWGQAVAKALKQRIDRAQYSKELENSCFNISHEALRLEALLNGCINRNDHMGD